MSYTLSSTISACASLWRVCEKISNLDREDDDSPRMLHRPRSTIAETGTFRAIKKGEHTSPNMVGQFTLPLKNESVRRVEVEARTKRKYTKKVSPKGSVESTRAMAEIAHRKVIESTLRLEIDALKKQVASLEEAWWDRLRTLGGN